MRAYKVELNVAGKVETLTVEEGDNVLDAALEAGLDLTHDCKMGVRFSHQQLHRPHTAQLCYHSMPDMMYDDHVLCRCA